MPCQEPPIAMSTWQAAIHVPKGCMVVMSGNPIAKDVSSIEKGILSWFIMPVTQVEENSTRDFSFVPGTQK